MNKILELFGHSTQQTDRIDWQNIIRDQQCPFLGRKCYKVRKSDPIKSIGTCIVLYGKERQPILICPTRLIERRKIFTDCLHLLTKHEPGNELHVVSEVSVPGGSVDYFLVSVKEERVKDFVGIELQTLDTTGTVWPERQRLLRELGIPLQDDSDRSSKSFGMNWKMTAKTILVQMHHKIQTFEHFNKNLVLVIQDRFLQYMRREFNFSHVRGPASIGDSVHFHAYRVERQSNDSFGINLDSRISTDSNGVGVCLGLQADARIDMDKVICALQRKISKETLFSPA